MFSASALTAKPGLRGGAAPLAHNRTYGADRRRVQNDVMGPAHIPRSGSSFSTVLMRDVTGTKLQMHTRAKQNYDNFISRRYGYERVRKRLTLRMEGRSVDETFPRSCGDHPREFVLRIWGSPESGERRYLECSRDAQHLRPSTVQRKRYRSPDHLG